LAAVLTEIYLVASVLVKAFKRSRRGQGEGSRRLVDVKFAGDPPDELLLREEELGAHEAAAAHLRALGSLPRFQRDDQRRKKWDALRDRLARAGAVVAGHRQRHEQAVQAAASARQREVAVAVDCARLIFAPGLRPEDISAVVATRGEPSEIESLEVQVKEHAPTQLTCARPPN
jgi:hypothetical protein